MVRNVSNVRECRILKTTGPENTTFIKFLIKVYPYAMTSYNVIQVWKEKKQLKGYLAIYGHGALILRVLWHLTIRLP